MDKIKCRKNQKTKITIPYSVCSKSKFDNMWDCPEFLSNNIKRATTVNFSILCAEFLSAKREKTKIASEASIPPAHAGAAILKTRHNSSVSQSITIYCIQLNTCVWKQIDILLNTVNPLKYFEFK